MAPKRLRVKDVRAAVVNLIKAAATWEAGEKRDSHPRAHSVDEALLRGVIEKIEEHRSRQTT